MDDVQRIKFIGYKSFDEETVIDLNGNITLFIGKNNCGKSSAVDIIEAVFCPVKHLSINRDIKSLAASFELTEPHIARAFSKSISGGDVGENYYSYGMKFVGKEIFIKVYADGRVELLEGQGRIGYPAKHEWISLAETYAKYNDHVIFRRIDAERDIKPEKESNSTDVSPNGDGTTNIVRMFMNNSAFDESLVEKKILDELNKIMTPETCFESIKVQQVKKGEELFWEIFLTEKDSERFSLSKSGSGLKTLLLILVNLYLLPSLKQNNNKKIVFAFEELENNLHPAIQRKLFDYLYQYAVDTGNRIVLTTHSHVAINCIFEKEKSTIYHVEKKNGISRLSEVSNYVDKVEILDDLDVRASDLLQSNGIIWVEGPSDRIYIKKWLEVIGCKKYVEGRDYQFLYYGGRLLKHYTADDELEGLINILTTNRNAAIVIDSDKRYRSAKINDTKTRIMEEFEKQGHFCWITKGKEIENYIPSDALNKAFDKRFEQIGQYDLFPKYIYEVDPTFESHKVDFAKKVCSYIISENVGDVMDLKKSIEELEYHIEKWNQ